MAIKIIRNDQDYVYGVKEFYLDTPDDLKNLPKNAEVGSSALVISTGEVYLINSLGEWIQL